MIALWTDLDGLTNDYHNGGGAVVLADSVERACVLLRAAAVRLKQTDQELVESVEILHGPGGSGGVERVVIFPNAGCC